MKNIKKLIVLLFMVLGYAESSIASSTSAKSRLKYTNKTAKNSSKNRIKAHDSVENTVVQTPIEPQQSAVIKSAPQYSITQNQMVEAMQKRSEKFALITKVEDQANMLIKQNYKTDGMKYAILLLMNDTPFMHLNPFTASIDNLPTIHEILQKTLNKNIEKQIAANGLRATLKAINGALADDEYENKAIFAGPVKIELQKMQKLVELRLKEVDPASWMKFYIGTGAIAALAAAVSIYYSGITTKDAQEYINNAGKNIIATAGSISKQAGAALSPTKDIASSAAKGIVQSAGSINPVA